MFLAALHGMTKNFSCKFGFAGIITAISYLIGDPKSSIISGIIVLIALDWLTGMIVAWNERELNSKKALQGGIKILIFFSLCVVAYQISVKIQPALLGLLDNMIYAYIATTEAISILENLNKLCVACNAPMPFIGGLIKHIKTAQKKIDGKEEITMTCKINEEVKK